MDAAIGECLARTAAKYPDREALWYREKSYTWRQLDGRVECLARFFEDNGIQKGMSAGIVCKGSDQWVCSFLALQKIGAVAVLINLRGTPQESGKQIQASDVDFLCCDERGKEEICGSSCSFRLSGRAGSLGLYQAETCRCEPDGSLAHTAYILFTSGSWGIPKAVMLSQEGLVRNAGAFCGAMGWMESERVCVAVPMYHVMGLVDGLLGALCCGFCMVLPQDTAAVVKTLDRQRCTAVIGTPSLFLSLVRCLGLTGGRYALSEIGFCGRCPFVALTLKLLYFFLEH